MNKKQRNRLVDEFLRLGLVAMAMSLLPRTNDGPAEPVPHSRRQLGWQPQNARAKIDALRSEYAPGIHRHGRRRAMRRIRQLERQLARELSPEQKITIVRHGSPGSKNARRRLAALAR